jgi:hypothetical protein
VILKIAGESNPAAVVSHVCHQVPACRVGHAAARAAFFDHLFPYQAQLAQNACVWWSGRWLSENPAIQLFGWPEIQQSKHPEIWQSGNPEIFL